MNYVVYLTMYKGNKMPKWYIGSSNQTKVSEGYNGSISSKKYKNIYLNEQKQNKSLFKTRILSYHLTRKDALIEELRVQKIHKVVRNDRYINMSYASVNGFFGRDVSGENNPNYKVKWSKIKKIIASCKMMGTKRSKESKEKQSKSISKHKHWNYGKELSIETKEKISKSSIGKHYDDSRDGVSMNVYYGKEKSNEIKKKISNSNYHIKSSFEERFGEEKSNEVKEKISKALKGENNPRAIKWKLISPNNEEFIIFGNLEEFCNDNDISASSIRGAADSGKKIKKGKAKAWQSFRI